MRPTQVLSALETAIKAQQPVMLHGSPGVGKSQIVKQLAEKLKMSMIDLRLSQLDSADLRGLPVVEGNKTDWATPKFLPTRGKGILFLDEINSAAQATQAAAYQLVLDRKLGDYELPKGWVVIAAGNRTSDRAIVNQMSTALKNRFVHINYEVNNDDWQAWALSSGINDMIRGFLRFRPNLLNEFDMQTDTAEEKAKRQQMKDVQAFATPRSWEFLSKLLEHSPEDSVLYELTCGVVGEGVAAEFTGYCKYHKALPDVDALLKDPSKFKPSKEPAVNYAFSTALASKVTAETINNFFVLVNKLSPEYQAMCVKDAVHRCKAIVASDEFKEWIPKITEFA